MTALLSVVRAAHIRLDSSHSQQGLCKGSVVNFSIETNVPAADSAFHLLLKNAVCHFEHDPVPHTETPRLIQRVVEENTLLALKVSGQLPLMTYVFTSVAWVVRERQAPGGI